MNVIIHKNNDKPEKGVYARAGCHILDRHRRLDGDQRRVEQHAYADTADKDIDLLLRARGILLEHGHETESDGHNEPASPEDRAVFAGL